MDMGPIKGEGEDLYFFDALDHPLDMETVARIGSGTEDLMLEVDHQRSFISVSTSSGDKVMEPETSKSIETSVENEANSENPEPFDAGDGGDGGICIRCIFMLAVDGWKKEWT